MCISIFIIHSEFQFNSSIKDSLWHEIFFIQIPDRMDGVRHELTRNEFLMETFVVWIMNTETFEHWAQEKKSREIDDCIE